jgi:hypothetical protein
MRPQLVSRPSESTRVVAICDPGCFTQRAGSIPASRTTYASGLASAKHRDDPLVRNSLAIARIADVFREFM